MTPVRRNKRADIHRMWSWWTLTEGNHNAALKHVWQAFKHEPFNTKSETWRLHHSRPLNVFK
jgi:hypothetical protein